MRFCVFGLIVADLIAEPVDLRGLPATGALTRLNSLVLYPGGNGCNVPIALAKLRREGADQVLASGVVGDDLIGEVLTRRMREAGVDVGGIKTLAGVQTSATVVAVSPGGEPYYLHAPGALARVDAACFRENLLRFAGCDWLHIGYFGLLPREVFVEMPGMLGELRRANPRLRISFDTAHEPRERELLNGILPYLDVFCPSRAEGMSLTGESEPGAMVASFRRQMARGIIGIKLDREGCWLDEGGAAVMCPAYAVKMVDATGAGDAWYAGLIAALARGMPLEVAGRLANRVAADSCERFSGTAGIGDFESTMGRC